jgi:hypothetical protein
MSTTRDFLAGIASLIHETGIGVYDPDRTWTNADTAWAVALGPSVPEDPPKAIVLSAYSPAPDDPKMTDSLLAVQMRLRGDEDPGSVQDVNDALFTRFQGMHDTTVGGVALVLLWRQSSLPAPADENHRQQYSSNWYAQIAQTSNYRTD